MSKLGVCLGTRTGFVALPLSTDSVQIWSNFGQIPTFGDSGSRWIEGLPLFTDSKVGWESSLAWFGG